MGITERLGKWANAIWIVVIGGLALAAAALRFYWTGRADGAAGATAEADKKRVREAAANRDDDAVLREWRRRP